MKRWIISVPVDVDTSILDAVMSTVMPGSIEYDGRKLIDILSHDDAFDPAVIDGASALNGFIAKIASYLVRLQDSLPKGITT